MKLTYGVIEMSQLVKTKMSSVKHSIKMLQAYKHTNKIKWGEPVPVCENNNDIVRYKTCWSGVIFLNSNNLSWLPQNINCAFWPQVVKKNKMNKLYISQECWKSMYIVQPGQHIIKVIQILIGQNLNIKILTIYILKIKCMHSHTGHTNTENCVRERQVFTSCKLVVIHCPYFCHTY